MDYLEQLEKEEQPKPKPSRRKEITRAAPVAQVDTDSQNMEEKTLKEKFLTGLVFRHFKENKVEIASAITQPFPFLMSLRDRAFISEQRFENVLEACRNLVPVPRVMYDVLSDLEKTFDVLLLETLFSRVNLKAYPDLNEVFRSFQNVVPDQSYLQGSDEEERWEGPSSQLSLQQGTDLPSLELQRNLCPVCQVDIKKEEPFFNSEVEQKVQARTKHTQASDTIVIHDDDSEESSDEHEPLEISILSAEKNPVINIDDPSESTEAEEDQEGTFSPYQTALGEDLPVQRIQSNSCSVYLVDIMKNKSFFNLDVEQQAQARINHNQASNIMGISSEESEESSDEDEPLLFDQALESEPEVSNYDSSESSEGEDIQEVTCSQLQTAPGQKRRHIDSVSSPPRERRRGRPRINIPVSDRGPGKRYQPTVSRFSRDKNMNFQLPELPVTCGNLKGTLYKEKLKQGSSEKCIQSEDGRWFTPKEFEMEGGYAKSKNWKQSIRCGGYPLKHLIENGYLQPPPRTRKGRRILKSHNKTLADPCQKNSNICEVCRKWGKMFCCDTCPRSFHEDCHIPPVEHERNPWSCIFCEIKAIQERCPESPPCHQESEVLVRQMLPEEQLKCEFVLLKVYCDARSLSFDSGPYYRRGRSQGPEKPMWLNKVKETLNEKMYPQVKGFVEDMRLIFQNYKVFYRDKKSIKGLQVEHNFEKNFKNIFAIQGTSRKNF
ncbi:nuclear autoantigen Sp-100 isoform X3 [Nycticebus coucang]|nr:nuclear autoantigen Sp-100 isoform X3 [Nycticebus coucang]